MHRVYFSHGYKPHDRAINEFFWNVLRTRCYSWIDSGLSEAGAQIPMDVSFNEWMMSQCDGFVAVIRSRDLPLGFSPYQLLEYELATRLRLPRFICMEDGVQLPQPLEDTRVTFPLGWRQFFAEPKQTEITTAVDEFFKQTTANAAARGVLRAAGHWCRPPSGSKFKAALLPPTITAWQEAFRTLDRNLRHTVKLTTLSPYELQHEFEAIRLLADCQVLIVDVGPHGTPPELLGFLHAIGIPQIRVCRVANEAERAALAASLSADNPPRAIADAESESGLPRFLDELQLHPQETPVGFWQHPAQLVQHIQRTLQRISSFNKHIHRLESRREAREYFGMRYPQPPRARVFLSYRGAGGASEATNQIARVLRFKNFECFHYQDPDLTGEGRVSTGEHIHAELITHLRASDIVVAFADDAYRSSPYCMLELTEAVALSGVLKLLPFTMGQIDLSKTLGDIAPFPYSRNNWNDSVLIEDMIETIERVANAITAEDEASAEQLKNWLESDNFTTRESLTDTLINANADPDQVRAWIASLPEKGWQTSLLDLPGGPGRQRHAELLTLLLLALVEGHNWRRSTVELCLRRRKLLTWAKLGRPKPEKVVAISVPVLGANPPTDPRLLGEKLGQLEHCRELPNDEEPLCLQADAHTLACPVEYTRLGRDGDALALIRSVRWRLEKVNTRETLHELRLKQGLPPSVLILSLGCHEIERLESEADKVKEVLVEEFRAREWPPARIEKFVAKTAAEVQSKLTDCRYGIVHIAAHAAPSGLSIGDEKIPAEKLARMLEGSDVRLLVLNGCAGADARSSVAHGTVTLADHVIARGSVPEVVAHRGPVLDTDALFFARHFYPDFLRNLDLGSAVYAVRRRGSEQLALNLVAVSQRPT